MINMDPANARCRRRNRKSFVQCRPKLRNRSCVSSIFVHLWSL